MTNQPAQATLRGAELRRYIEETLDPGAHLTGNEDAGELVAELDRIFASEGGSGITAQQMDWYLSYKRNQRSA